jgi:hypothetical protein
MGSGVQEEYRGTYVHEFVQLQFCAGVHDLYRCTCMHNQYSGARVQV